MHCLVALVSRCFAAILCLLMMIIVVLLKFRWSLGLFVRSFVYLLSLKKNFVNFLYIKLQLTNE